ncbi:D-glycero-alpha-D-manno-heptose-1,7-bisphosphate 7-phosphatase [Streptomyces sp. NPDC102406]|uniref:D-glycero-alpha-D-manno-heptose-1,7-bisphosphate 7-phosphatase n=1 Tax=Streptomyces sp. NPDC102406 TaxID=3366171 RepID=UPI0037FD3FEB
MTRRPSTEGPWLSDGDGPGGMRRVAAGLPAAVLFDRDGTLVEDVPYNGDPERVRLMPTARGAVEAVRAAGIPVGVVSNQSGVARGLLTRAQVDAVRRRVDALLGPFDVWAVCPHGPDEGCGCRKPEPGLVLAACERLGVPAGRAVVIGDIGADVAAARAAGARGVLVPTPVTRAEEIEAADTVAPDLLAAVRLALTLPGRGAAMASSGAPAAGEERR